MKLKRIFFYSTIIFGLLACKKNTSKVEDKKTGFKMLLMGNSFFKPYASKIEELAKHAGYSQHKSTVVFRGGENGRPINLWNSTGSENELIKETLDRGGIDILGMTAGNLPENPTDGFKDWIEYALEKNPDITVLLSIPPIDFPNHWQQRAEELEFESIDKLYDYYINVRIHKDLIDELRIKFPSTKIFSIPTGLSSLKLRKMQENGELLDNISYMGEWDSSLFTDEKGHQGKIITITGTLMWLNAIYKENLSENTYKTGFNTDIHFVAQEIMNNHDKKYKN